MNTEPPIRIVHLTVYRDLPAGVRKQIKYEHEAGEHLRDARWTSLALHNGRRTEAFEQAIPTLFRPILLRALYGWIVALRLSRRYDFVLVRHMNFDPFAFVFAPLIPNRVSVHHSKEVEELPLIRPGLSGIAAAALERLTGRFAVRCSAGVLGVTTEIARYECETRAPGKPFSAYPNGIAPDSVALVEDRRSPTEVHAVFICETFSEWHGLDRLLHAFASADRVPPGLVVHLIGNLSNALQAQLAALGDRRSFFRVHGFLDLAAYKDILAVSDVGLGSLALDRQNLREGATLKVRELLAQGLPVYSGHRDTALPESFPYYLEQPVVDVAQLHAFAMRMKKASRTQVREASVPHIDKRSAMQHVADWLRETFLVGTAGSSLSPTSLSRPLAASDLEGQR